VRFDFGFREAKPFDGPAAAVGKAMSVYTAQY